MIIGQLFKNRNLLIFTLFSIFYFPLSSSSAQAASLYLSPSSKSYKVGQSFSVEVFVSSADQAMNAASGIISFPQDKLEAVSLSKSGSIISLWTLEPSFSNSAAGAINFEGIVLNPGFIGASGKIITINFKAKAAGSAALSFLSGSILANDGKGTNILTELGSASFSITASAASFPEAPAAEKNISSSVLPSSKVPPLPELHSSTHPNQEKWYQNSNSEFSWKITPDILGVSLYFNNKPASNPGQVSDGIFGAKTYENLADGVWYFHLKLKNSFGWGAIAHYKVQIDTVAPKQFAINLVDGKETENPCPEIIFSAEDQLSGMDYYKVKVGEGAYNTVVHDAVKNNNSYILPCQEPGRKIIIVEAFDNAGNYTVATEEMIVKTIASPIFTDYPKQIKAEEILMMAGKAAPNAKVTIWLQREKDEARSIDVKSDENGNFVFIAGEKLKEGVYKIWAEAIDSKGAKSGPSEKITVEAVAPNFLRIGRLAIDYLTIIITFMVLSIGMLAIIVYLFYWITRWRKKIKKETREMKDITARAFKALVDKVEEQVASIDGNPRLSKREKIVSENLKKSLNIAEGFIEKEIKDLEDDVK